MKSTLSPFLVCFALLAPRVSGTYPSPPCEQSPFFAALNSGGLDAYADFVCEYAPEVADQENTLIYAPNNKAVDAYLAGNPQASANAKLIRDFIVRRSVPDPNANAAAEGNTGLASNSNNNFGSLPPRGSTGGGGSAGAKISRPAGAAGGGRKRQSPLPPGYVGTLTAGGGGVAVVLKDAVPYGSSNNYYFEIDRYASQFNFNGVFNRVFSFFFFFLLFIVHIN